MVYAFMVCSCLTQTIKLYCPRLYLRGMEVVFIRVMREIKTRPLLFYPFRVNADPLINYVQSGLTLLCRVPAAFGMRFSPCPERCELQEDKRPV